MVTRKSTYVSLGGLDDRELKIAYNDVDYCLRLKEAGYKIYYVASVVHIHHESYSRGLDISAEKAARLRAESEVMFSRWGHLIAADPYHNPNLSLQAQDGAYASPPRIQYPWRS